MQIIYDTPELHTARVLKNFDTYKNRIKDADTMMELDKICAELEKLKGTDELTQKQFDYLVTKLGRKYYTIAKREGV